jgi:hypothetical protein
MVALSLRKKSANEDQDDSLSWFRGTQDWIWLSSDGKTIVIYGQNGFGKFRSLTLSSMSSDGKIGHLAQRAAVKVRSS